MEEQVIRYIVDHWETTLSALGGAFVAVASAAWAIAKMHYSQQTVVSKIQCDYLVKQLDEKDKFARGIIEVMGQRLCLANEEPQRLQKIIDEKESQLRDISQENKSLLEKIEVSKDELDISQLISNMGLKNMRQTLRATMDYSAKCFPEHRHLSPLRTYFFVWDKSTNDSDTNLSDIVSYLALFTKVQALHSAELDIGLRHCYSDLSSIKKETFDSMSLMLRSLSSNGINIPNNSDPYAYMIHRIPRHQIEYYLKLAEQIEDNKKEKENGDEQDDPKNDIITKPSSGYSR